MKIIRITALILMIIFFKLSVFGQKENDTTKNVTFAAIPIVNYDNTLGASLGVLGQMFYKVNKEDTISPSSSTGVFGMYTTNHTYFAAAFQRLYLKEDQWRIMAAFGLGNMNFQYWQELPVDDGIFIEFGTHAIFAIARVERKVYKKLYAGVSGTYAKAKTEFDVPDYFPDSLRFDERYLNNIGYLFNYDTRDHQLNPYGGFNVEFKNNFFREWLSSDNNFQKFELTYNHYYKIKNKKNILATRIKANIATGDVPFQGQNVVGQDDIRGYTSGKYRNNQVYTAQAEYRWRFYKKFGMVGFFGIASAVENMGDIFKSEVLPGAGVGLRYMMIPKERINIGIDVAAGKDDWGIYFRIAESFGR